MRKEPRKWAIAGLAAIAMLLTCGLAPSANAAEADADNAQIVAPAQESQTTADADQSGAETKAAKGSYRTLRIGRYFANLSSASSSAGYNISPGQYYVWGNGAASSINIDVCSYYPASGNTNSCDYYDVGYNNAGGAYITVRNNEQVRIHSYNSSAAANWQLRKRYDHSGAMTPGDATIRKGGNYFSDVSPHSSYGIQPGLYLVKSSGRNNSVKVCNYDVTRDYESACRYYDIGSSYGVAEIQVNQNQRVVFETYYWQKDVVSSWKPLKQSTAKTVYSPQKEFHRRSGTYYVGDTLPAGRFLVRAGQHVTMDVCYYHAAGNETSSCYNVDLDDGAQVRLYPGQRVVINPYAASSADTTWNALSSTSGNSKYLITFNSRGGSKVASQSVTRGQKATRPRNPSRAGYNFRGWTTDGAGKHAYNFNAPVYGNVTLYAQWTPRQYTIYFDGNHGSVSFKSKKVTMGARYGNLPTASRPGYRFLGWYTAQGNKVTSQTVVGMASNRTFHAKWARA